MSKIEDAVREFVDAWEFGVAAYVADNASVTCKEAETLAALFRVVGDSTTADDIIREHAKDDDDPSDLH
jgi:hypothetical protein